MNAVALAKLNILTGINLVGNYNCWIITKTLPIGFNILWQSDPFMIGIPTELIQKA